MSAPDLAPEGEEPGEDPVGTVPRRHLLILGLAVVLGTASMLWVSAGIAYVIESRPGRTGGTLFSIPGATAQMVVATAGAITLMAIAVRLGDRATGGDGAWVRRDLVLTTLALAALWIVLAVTTP